MAYAGKWILVFVLTLAISFAGTAVLQVGMFSYGIIAMTIDVMQSCKQHGVKPEDCHLTFTGLL